MTIYVGILWLGGLCTDADADDTDNYARRTNLDYIGSFGRVPNEPKKGSSPERGLLLVTNEIAGKFLKRRNCKYKKKIFFKKEIPQNMADHHCSIMLH